MPITRLVVPCYNEAARLDIARFEAGLAALSDLELLFVDDGSTDATAEILAAACARLGPRATWFSQPTNQGKAEAVRVGMLRALSEGAHATGYWDADLATPLEELPRLTAVLDERPEVLAVLGSRVRLLGRHIDRKTTRHYLGRGFASVASLLLSIPVYDTQCGAKVFRACDAVEASLAEPFASRWIFDVQLIARLLAQCGTRDALYEVGLTTWRDVEGSKVKPKHFAMAALELRTMADDLKRARAIPVSKTERDR